MGSLGMSKNKSGNTSESTYQDSVWGPSGDAMGNLYEQLNQMFGTTAANAGAQDQFGRQYGQNVMEDVIPAWQQNLNGGAFAGMDNQNALATSLNRNLNAPTNTQRVNNQIMGGEGNNYADAMKNFYVDDANRASDNMLANLDARAAGSQMSGGARQGVAIARGMDDINRNLQRGLGEVGYNTFENDLNRKLGIASQADANTLSREQLLSNLISGEQNARNSGMDFSQVLNNFAGGQQRMPWEQAGMYKNAMGGPVVLGGGQSTGSGKSSGKGAALAVGNQGK